VAAGQKNTRTCAACGASLPPVAKYCNQCGKPTHGHLVATKKALRKEAAQSQRNVRAVAVVFIGVLGALGSFFLLGIQEWPVSVSILFEHGLFILIGFAGVLLLGRKALEVSLAKLPRGVDMALGLATGIAAFLLGGLYILFLSLFAEISDVPSLDRHLLVLILEIAVLPALVEEWLCRGVLWTACRRVSSTRTTIVATALLFALLHLPGWGPAGVPHRFVVGLMLGWLRGRSGSLLPGVAAHFVLNLLVVVLVDAL
jgi:membrane protease YdiL (CAAX protease family)